MKLSRKKFLQLSAASLGSLLLGERPSSAQKTGLAMLYDATKCVGCRACQNACKGWNNLPDESNDPGGIYETPRNLEAETWNLIKVAESGDDWSFINYQCMHCNQASCVSVCPTGAAYHAGEFVLIDQEWCIGCGYCVQACPFNVPHRSLAHGTARKCTFCFDRVSDRQRRSHESDHWEPSDWPACAAACPTGALTWGQRDELLAKAKDRVEDLKSSGYPDAHLYGERELGGLGRLSILALPTEAYGLPESPSYATGTVLTQWASGIATAAVAAVVPFWVLFRRRRGAEVKADHDGGGEES